MREQTQYTTMLPNYNIPTDMQAPFHSTPFSVQPGPVVTGQPPTTAHRPMQAIQCTTEAAPLFSSESRESGRGRWWAVEEEEKTSRLREHQATHCQRSRSSALRQGRGRELFPTPGYPLPAHSSFPHQGTPCQRTVFPTPGYPLPALNARAILPTALATARRLPTAPRDRLRVRARAAPCGRTCHSPSQ